MHRPCWRFCVTSRGRTSLPATCPEADQPQTFRVSDAERRRKVDGARTRGRQALMSMGISIFGLWEQRWVLPISGRN